MTVLEPVIDYVKKIRRHKKTQQTLGQAYTKLCKRASYTRGLSLKSNSVTNTPERISNSF